MPGTENAPADVTNGHKELPPDSQDNNDTSVTQEGYEIHICVTSQGFAVEGPEPLSAAPQGESEPKDYLPDLTTAIKHVLAIVKENPITEDANAQMEAGYKSA